MLLNVLMSVWSYIPACIGASSATYLQDGSEIISFIRRREHSMLNQSVPMSRRFFRRQNLIILAGWDLDFQVKKGLGHSGTKSDAEMRMPFVLARDKSPCIHSRVCHTPDLQLQLSLRNLLVNPQLQESNTVSRSLRLLL